MVRMRFGGQIVKFERCRCHDQRFTNDLLYIDDMFERVFPRRLHSKLGEGDYACAVGGGGRRLGLLRPIRLIITSDT